jgi:aryl-alcohol dehydrogenase-like predicted oxidoreductase
MAARAEALVVPIPGTTRVPRLEESLGSAGIQLTPDDLGEIEKALPQAEGDRYAPAQQRLIDR